ncbi:MAG: cytidine deaminase, partial [Bacteroidales bacterium]|nr:cytidine deaminase [Bacteroidales bacterium]
ENASYGATICAERVAACSAIAAGQRQWLAIAIATSTGGAPCGICRQFLAEFAPDLEVFTIATQHGQINRYLVRELLPHAFKL